MESLFFHLNKTSTNIVLILLDLNINIKYKINNMKKKIALIFGITGQDGSYLAELLLKVSKF